jgi:hypothetical protein
MTAEQLHQVPSPLRLAAFVSTRKIVTTARATTPVACGVQVPSAALLASPTTTPDWMRPVRGSDSERLRSGLNLRAGVLTDAYGSAALAMIRGD